jgi:glycosyltransferase involved in cell wall biosynthesis
MNNSLKILNICGYSWDIGGPPKIIFDHAEVQIKNGAEVTILTPMSEGQKLYALPEGAKVVVCKRDRLSKLWAEFSWELYQWLKAHGNEYDIIHIHGIWHFAGVAPFLLNLKTPKVITIHGLLDRWTISKGYWKKYIFGLIFQKRILFNTDLIQINNKDEEQDLIRFLGKLPKNVAIVPNGMKISNFENLPLKGNFRKKINLDNSVKLVLFLSRINLKKGLDLLLPAFQKVLEVRKDVKLILAGPDDGYLSETQRFIVENDLQSSIEWVGMLTGNDKLEAFVDADIFALPSYSEGFSIATLEALICGIPSILSDRVGFGEVLKERNAAYITELKVEAISEGILKMLNDSDYCERISENGKNLVKEKFDIEIVAQQLLNEFQKIAIPK